MLHNLETKFRALSYTIAPWTCAYVGSIAAINAAYVQTAPISVFGTALPPAVLLAGGVFVLRDFSQREVGKGVLVAMAAATALSYALTGPSIALASAAAFAVSETLDSAVFSWIRRPLSQRVLLSSAVSVPVDTLLFFGAIGITDAKAITLGIGAKMVAAVTAWSLIRWAEGRRGTRKTAGEHVS